MNSNGTKLRMESRTVGPLHDPYGRETLIVERLGHRFELESCGLAGHTYRYDGELVIANDYGEAAISMFTDESGAAPEQWQKWYYEHIYYEDPMGCLADYY